MGEFLQAEDEVKLYIREKYNVKVLCSSSLSLNKQVLARLHNNLINGLQEQPLLLKAIIFMFDGNVIKMIYHQAKGMQMVMELVLKNLFAGVHRAILVHKEKLLVRAKKAHYPTVLWAMTPLHCDFPPRWNLHRKMFNKSLEIAAC